MKYAQKQYWDVKHKATESKLQEGKKVLLKQEKYNKLSTPYETTPYKLINKTGNQVTER